MSATDELRRMLDERGVEWEDSEPYGAKAVTRFKVNDVWLRYVDYGDYCWVDYHEDEPLTPEQTIAATLGSGTCHIEERHGDWHCTGCGEMVGTCDTTSELYIDGNAIGLWRFCPNCGRKVVTDG